MSSRETSRTAFRKRVWSAAIGTMRPLSSGSSASSRRRLSASICRSMSGEQLSSSAFGRHCRIFPWERPRPTQTLPSKSAYLKRYGQSLALVRPTTSPWRFPVIGWCAATVHFRAMPGVSSAIEGCSKRRLPHDRRDSDEADWRSRLGGDRGRPQRRAERGSERSQCRDDRTDHAPPPWTDMRHPFRSGRYSDDHAWDEGLRTGLCLSLFCELIGGPAWHPVQTGPLVLHRRTPCRQVRTQARP